ncbi:winged helix DNA-binding domain-containing protein [Agromyces sp. SYSU K20354]|uniref:winged helix DNA-binding domain-containing protein n=1 Tax=Agromyces cavernae TaxID=2898659 RepID=UPI001E494D2B|nr:winged helix DNA-binding domain-containing protein [Agromyces cavernae]MCD2440664.1 winged helix DNA-binding domain-containing protein [Agromyces cavernae]
MDVATLRELRLRVQGLRAPFDLSAPEVVRRFVAVQAQEFVPAQWGLAARVPREQRPDVASVAAAIDDGEILRTHVLRPTWHFLHRDDARWVLDLSAERVHRANATYYRRTGLEGADVARAMDLVAAALDGGHRTRAEIIAALEADGMPKAGLGFTYVMMHAELERVAISGANVGRQRTYAAFDERVPAAAPKPRDEALAELAARFIASRGPVTDRDFASWSGFTLGDTRQAFADAADRAGAHGGRIEQVDVDGVTHLLDAEAVAAASARSDGARDAGHRDDGDGDHGIVDLLQAYDEYIMGYAAPRAYLLPDGIDALHAEFPLHALMIDGVMCGRWAPVADTKRVRVRLVPWRGFTAREERGLEASVADLEAFFGLPAAIEREAVTSVERRIE